MRPNRRVSFGQIHGLPDLSPAAGDLATMVTANQQHIFYRGIDNAIHHVFWDAPTNHLYHDNWNSLPDKIIMSPADWFTPYRKIWQDKTDMDVGSGGVMLIPQSDYPIAAGKDGILYLLDRNSMDKFDNFPSVPGCPSAPQTRQDAIGLSKSLCWELTNIFQRGSFNRVEFLRCTQEIGPSGHMFMGHQCMANFRMETPFCISGPRRIS